MWRGMRGEKLVGEGGGREVGVRILPYAHGGISARLKNLYNSN